MTDAILATADTAGEKTKTLALVELIFEFGKTIKLVGGGLDGAKLQYNKGGRE